MPQYYNYNSNSQQRQQQQYTHHHHYQPRQEQQQCSHHQEQQQYNYDQQQQLKHFTPSAPRVIPLRSNVVQTNHSFHLENKNNHYHNHRQQVNNNKNNDVYINIDDNNYRIDPKNVNANNNYYEYCKSNNVLFSQQEAQYQKQPYVDQPQTNIYSKPNPIYYNFIAPTARKIHISSGMAPAPSPPTEIKNDTQSVVESGSFFSSLSATSKPWYTSHVEVLKLPSTLPFQNDKNDDEDNDDIDWQSPV